MCGACSAAFRHVLRNELRIIESVCPLQNSGDSPKNHIVAIAKNRGWNDGGGVLATEKCSSIATRYLAALEKTGVAVRNDGRAIASFEGTRCNLLI